MSFNPPMLPADRHAIRTLLEHAEAELARMRPLFAEQPGLRIELRLIYPDLKAWHCHIWDRQVSTDTLLPLEAGEKDLQEALIAHLVKKIELASAN